MRRAELRRYSGVFLAPWSGKREVGYWIAKQFWGQGIATSALHSFLQIENERPLYARVAAHNIGSRRVLEKCGFEKTGKQKALVESSGKEIEEYLFIYS